MKQDTSIKRVIARLEQTSQRAEEELKKLCEEPTVHDVATQLTDRLLGDLMYLFNFDHMVSGRGQKTDIQEVYERLQENIKTTFLTVTGKEYEPTVCRQLKFNRRGT